MKLQEIDCQVRVAGSARQALELLEQETADILITDVKMNGMTGLELIETAGRKCFAKRFIVISGFDAFEYAKTALRLGVTDYLLKPIDKEELRSDICRIAEELGKKKELDRMQAYRKYYTHIERNDYSPLMKKCMLFIREYFASEISLSMLAEHVGRSENYLCAVFRKECGSTFLDIVNEYRLREALFLLLYSPVLPIRDVGIRVGYATERQLFRLFHSTIGLTPQQVRNLSVLDEESQEN